MDSTTVNSIGLLLDIVGAALLFFFGLPRKELSRTGAQHLVLEQTDEAERDLARRYDQLSNAGLCLLVVGFSPQLISNYI